MNPFRRRQPIEPTPVYIVRPKPRPRIPWLLVAGLLFLVAMAALRGPAPAPGPTSSAPGQSAPGERGLDLAIEAASERGLERIRANDAKCDAILDDEPAYNTCVELSTALEERWNRLTDCLRGVVRVSDVARCEAAP